MDSTTRWISILGVGTIIFGIALFVLRIPVRTIIVFFIIGIPVIALWLYVESRAKQQSRIDTITAQACICSICKHEEAKSCLQQKCACCIIMKKDIVVGHSVNPLQ